MALARKIDDGAKEIIRTQYSEVTFPGPTALPVVSTKWMYQLKEGDKNRGITEQEAIILIIKDEIRILKRDLESQLKIEHNERIAGDALLDAKIEKIKKEFEKRIDALEKNIKALIIRINELEVYIKNEIARLDRADEEIRITIRKMDTLFEERINTLEGDRKKGDAGLEEKVKTLEAKRGGLSLSPGDTEWLDGELTKLKDQINSTFTQRIAALENDNKMLREELARISSDALLNTTVHKDEELVLPMQDESMSPHFWLSALPLMFLTLLKTPHSPKRYDAPVKAPVSIPRTFPITNGTVFYGMQRAASAIRYAIRIIPK